MAVEKEARKVFERLKLSSAYSPSPPKEDMEKWKLFEKFWVEESIQLRKNFKPTGFDNEGMHAIGFVMEELTKRSEKLPLKNTKIGKLIAGTILSRLRDEERSNPDILWVKVSGKYAEVVGIGEIKTGFRAWNAKPHQMGAQIDVLKHLAEKKGKFCGKTLVHKNAPKKLLVLPKGSSKSFKKRKKDDRYLSDVEILEIEFLYKEIEFITKELFPLFKPEVSFGDGEAEKFRKGLWSSLNEWTKTALGLIYPEIPPDRLPTESLTLFTLAFGKLPSDEAEIQTAEQVCLKTGVKKIFFGAFVVDNSPLKSELMARLLPLASNDITQAKRFMCALKEFRKSAWRESSAQTKEKIQSMENIDPLKLLPQ